MSLTPMMQQYRDAKERHPGMLLLFRMGDFFELFEEDAKTASRILGLTLTSRDKSIPMAGIPHHALDRYLPKLLKTGCRVAICDQVEEASQAKGIVRREVVRIVTPGTVTEDEFLDPQQNNFLAAIVPHGKLNGIAWVEPTTGRFFAADVSVDRLASELGRLSPAECLVSESEEAKLGERLGRLCSAAAVTTAPDWTFDPETSFASLSKHYQVSTFTGFGFADDQPCLTAAGALLDYLRTTLKANLAHLGRLQRFRQDHYVLLDDVTRRSLELTRTLRENERDGSVLAVVDRTTTPMGARLLHEWLIAPLARRVQIERRLDAVAEFTRSNTLRQELRGLLRQSYDLGRLTARVSTGRASPRDLSSVAKTLRILPTLKAKITGRKAQLLVDLEGRLELFPELRSTLDKALVEEPPTNAREGGLIRDGFNQELDSLRDIARGGKNWLIQYQADEIKNTGIPTLKVGYNKVHGYYIEVTHAHRDKVPGSYQRRQTLKNAERFITPELKEHEEEVLGAEDKLKQLELELFQRLRDQIASETQRLMRTAATLASLDVLAGLAELAVERGYTRPEFFDDPIVQIENGRHPVLDQLLPPGTFVPNDVELRNGSGRLWLITGPNMSGKSTFIRQVALLTLMAHIGSFVPASKMTVGVVDRIFTRVGASDELGRGQSTFMVEMTEAANILNNASERSLVILDEIGRGTSTYDGVSLAWSITEYLHNEVGCLALFATHYHELAQLADSLHELRNYNVQVKEWQDDVVFLHKIAAGSADKSYGIHVARLAGVPTDVLDRARAVLADLEAHHVQTKGKMINVRRRQSKPAESHLPLFDVNDE